MTHGTNHVETLNRVIADLQNEHTRWEDRARRLSLAVGATMPFDAGGQAEELRVCLARSEYVELLIRRYRNWLPAP